MDVLAPASYASTDNQKKSLAELPLHKKYALYEDISLENLKNYHSISCQPITVKAENDMELISDIITWGEQYLHYWEKGVYKCSRCDHPLYHSKDKYKGPCRWPSFRKSINNSILTRKVFPYYSYTVVVKEVYCGKCELFIGHQFEDGKIKGDIHPEAHWRH